MRKPSLDRVRGTFIKILDCWNETLVIFWVKKIGGESVSTMTCFFKGSENEEEE